MDNLNKKPRLTREERVLEISRLERKIAKRRRRSERKKTLQEKIKRSNLELFKEEEEVEKESEVFFMCSPGKEDSSLIQTGSKLTRKSGVKRRKDNSELSESSKENENCSNILKHSSQKCSISSQLTRKSEAKKRRNNSEEANCKPSMNESENVLELSIIEASQTPIPSRKKRRRSQRRNPLSGLRIRDVNRLATLDEDAGLPFAMPQPNLEMLLTRREFCLLKEFTGLKLEATRTRNVLKEEFESYESFIKPKDAKSSPKVLKLTPEIVDLRPTNVDLQTGSEDVCEPMLELACEMNLSAPNQSQTRGMEIVDYTEAPTVILTDDSWQSIHGFMDFNFSQSQERLVRPKSPAKDHEIESEVERNVVQKSPDKFDDIEPVKATIQNHNSPTKSVDVKPPGAIVDSPERNNQSKADEVEPPKMAFKSQGPLLHSPDNSCDVKPSEPIQMAHSCPAKFDQIEQPRSNQLSQISSPKFDQIEQPESTDESQTVQNAPAKSVSGQVPNLTVGSQIGQNSSAKSDEVDPPESTVENQMAKSTPVKSNEFKPTVQSQIPLNSPTKCEPKPPYESQMPDVSDWTKFDSQEESGNTESVSQLGNPGKERQCCHFGGR